MNFDPLINSQMQYYKSNLKEDILKITQDNRIRAIPVKKMGGRQFV